MKHSLFASALLALGLAACTDDATTPPPSAHQPEALPDDTADHPDLAQAQPPAEGIHAVAVHYVIDPGDSPRATVSAGLEKGD